MLGGNPVYDAPGDFRFGDALKKVAFTARLGLYEDETSALCQWHIPQAHSLEAWSDARAWDGTATIIQPLIAPLYGGKSAHDMLIGLSQTPGRAAYDVVRETWRLAAAGTGALDADQFWRTAVHDGVVAGTAFPVRTVAAGDVFAAIGRPAPAASGLELVLRADPTVHDGCFANLGWLQELPKPFTKLTWDNTVQLSPATASRLGIRNEDVVEVAAAGRTVKGPAWIVPGQADDTVAVHLGYGRTRAGRVGNGVGFDAYPCARPLPCGRRRVSPSGRRAAGSGWRARSSTTTWTAARSSARARSSSTAHTRASCTRWSTNRRRRSRCIPSTSTRATPGAWRST